MKQTFPILNTERLLLRQIIASDLENIYKGLSHPDVIKYYGVSFKTLEETKTQMEFYADLEANETGNWWAICSTDDKIFYGAAGLNNLNKLHRKAEIGFWLLPEFWNKGIILEAVTAICKYGFEKAGLHRVEAFVETENIGCKKVMDKLGFTHEGTMRDCEVKNGKYISLDIYARVVG